MMRYHKEIGSTDTPSNVTDYTFKNYFEDLVCMVVCLNNSFQDHKPILDYIGLTSKSCINTYSMMIGELRLNFKCVQNDTIGGPDKLLILLLEKLVAVLQKYRKEIVTYLPSMIQSFIKVIDTSLKSSSRIDQNITISNGSDVKCLKVMLESIKAKELSEDLTKHCFKTLHKLLFIGTHHEHSVVQCKCKNLGGIGSDEEEKYCTKFTNNGRPFRASMFNPDFGKGGKAPTRSRTASDPSSTECGNCGNRYKTAILARLKPIILTCISQLCQLNAKYLVEYYNMIFPDFQNKPIEKELQKPSVFYFIYNDARCKNLKEPIFLTSYYFLNSSGFEKYLVETADHSESNGPDIPDLSPRSHITLPKKCFSGSKTTADFEHDDNCKGTTDGVIFIEKLHYLFHYLISNETNPIFLCSMLKSLSVLIQRSPYPKLKSELVSECVLHLVQTNFNIKNKNANETGSK